MNQVFLTAASAAWLGVLTSISPCPLAANIAAISFLSRKINHPNIVLASSVAYIFGRVFTYTVLGVVIIASLVSIPVTANFLQKYMNMALGPILLVAGLFLLNILKLNISSFSISHKRQSALAELGIMGSFALGAIFALSFCPIAAGIFFGSLIPLALSSSYGMALPLFYGIGTGIPVAFFAISAAAGVGSASHWFKKARRLEMHTRKITGIIFLLIGAYFTWIYLVDIQPLFP